MKIDDEKQVEVAIAVKTLIDFYKKCIYMQILANNTVHISYTVYPTEIQLSKDGEVFAKWDDAEARTLGGRSGQQKTTPIDAVAESGCGVNGEYVEGLFTSIDLGKEIAKEWFKQDKLDQIADHEKQIAKLKKQFKAYE